MSKKISGITASSGIVIAKAGLEFRSDFCKNDLI